MVRGFPNRVYALSSIHARLAARRVRGPAGCAQHFDPLRFIVPEVHKTHSALGGGYQHRAEGGFARRSSAVLRGSA